MTKWNKKLSGILILGMVFFLIRPSVKAAGLEADLVLYNGEILTANMENPANFTIAEAVAIYDGKFVVVGGLVGGVLAAIAGNLPLAVAAIGGTAAALATMDFAADRLEELNFQLALTSRAAFSIDDLRRALAKTDEPFVEVTNKATGLVHILGRVTAESELVRLEWEAMARADASGTP